MAWETSYGKNGRVVLQMRYGSAGIERRNMKKNLDIREYAKDRNVNLWQVSERLGYAHETAFSRVLRHELSSEKKQEIRKIIDELEKEGY